MKQILILLLIICFSYSNSTAQNWEMMPYGADFFDMRCIYQDPTTNILYVGIWKKTIGTDTVNYIAYLDSNKWHSMGDGMGDHGATVQTIVNYHDTIYAGGAINYPNGPGSGIAKWNGEEWKPVGDSLCEGTNKVYNCCGNVLDLRVIDDLLYVGGIYDTIGCLQGNGIGTWNGTTWNTVHDFPNTGPGCCNTVTASCMFQNKIYVAGSFYSVDSSGNCIAYFDGFNWKTVGGGIFNGGSSVWDMIVYHDKLYVAGRFTIADGNPGNNIMSWDGNQWNDLLGGTDYLVQDLEVHNDKLYAVGGFTTAGGIPASKIALWDGTKWCSLGSNINSSIGCVGFYNDTLLIGGGFDHIDGYLLYYFAKWLGGDYIDTCSSTVGISEIHPDNFKFDLSPNPAATNFNISCTISQQSTLSIVNALGRIVIQQNIFPSTLNNMITTDDLADGVYLVTLSDGSNRASKKLVIAK